jgi:hypothetical protein
VDEVKRKWTFRLPCKQEWGSHSGGYEELLWDITPSRPLEVNCRFEEDVATVPAPKNKPSQKVSRSR